MKKREFSGPHQGMPVRYTGSPVERARGAMIMLHGRGAEAHDMIELATTIDEPKFLYAVPQARGQSWYPHSFIDPVSDNEPDLTSALLVIDDVLKNLSAGALPPEQVILLGFSQGACLVLEYAARNPRRYGGVIALSGCLFGPPDAPQEYEGSLKGTPVFLGCSEGDPQFPVERVTAAAEVMGGLDAEVTTRLYPEPGHGVNEDEIRHIRRLVELVQQKPL
jgi:predicted esterase